MTRSCLLFDLDGTLVDSLPDLTTAINQLRSDCDLGPLSPAQVRNFVGDGATALVQRALPKGAFDQDKLTSFLAYYQQHLCEQSLPYPGIRALLEQLQDTPLAVVTNKPRKMAAELLDTLGLTGYFRLVLGGDSCAQKKPHPAPLLEATSQLNAVNQTSLMIGDHHTDLRAAAAAGMPACFCRWGYGNAGGDSPAFTVSAVSELQQILSER